MSNPSTKFVPLFYGFCARLDSRFRGNDTGLLPRKREPTALRQQVYLTDQ